MRPFFSFRATVLVKIKLEGNVVDVPEEGKALIGARLVGIAQGYCGRFIAENLVETESIPMIASP
jgi:hypothetical protein